jgi:RNA polymerase sigma factor (sigma-70 family)
VISGNGVTNANGGLATKRAGRRVGELFDEQAPAVLRLCRLILRDPVEAEDATQQTFLSAYRALLRGTHPQDPAAWLAQIARNECRARLRRRELAAVPLDDDDAPDPRDPAEVASGREQLHAVTAAIGELPERQRQAVVLSDLRGLSNTEVSRALEVDSGALEALLYRGRLGVRRAFRRSWPATAVVPVSLRDSLARLIPDYGGSQAAGGAGAALLGAKLLAAPAAKVAAGVAVAAMAVGAATVEIEKAVVGPRPSTAHAATRPGPAVSARDTGANEVVALRNERHRGSGSQEPDAGRGSGPGPARRHEGRHENRPTRAHETESSSGPDAPVPSGPAPAVSVSSGPGPSTEPPSGNSGSSSEQSVSGAESTPTDSSGPSTEPESSEPSLEADSSGPGPDPSGSSGPSGSDGSGSGPSTTSSGSSGSDGSSNSGPGSDSSGSGSSTSASSGSDSSGSGGDGHSGSGE